VRPATRPSKQDLEALDALLQSRPPEGPLTPFEKPPAPVRELEPRFETAPRRAAARGGGGVVTPVLLGAAAALLVGGGVAAWYLLLRPSPPARQAQAPPRPTALATLATPPPTTLVAAPEPGASPVAPEAAPAVSAQPPTPAPPTSAAPTSPPTTPPRETPRPAGPASLADARGLMQRGAFSEAARAFAGTVRSAQANYSVQILVACSDDTVRKALDNVQAQELYILPVNYRGRDCYRVLWGLYETESRADSATRAVPDYFRRGGARPKVVTTSSVLP
jgi:septal ring-binding cell division protein DamX